MAKRAMTNPIHPDCHNWELIWDDGVGQRCYVCLICSEEQVFHYDYDEELDDDGVYTGNVVTHCPYETRMTELTNRAIAEALGYTVRKERNGYWYLIRPDGSKDTNIGDEQSIWNAVPDYLHDANAALSLFPPHFGIEIYIHSATEYQVRVYETFRHNDSKEIHETTLARALCYAWWSRVQSHNGKLPG